MAIEKNINVFDGLQEHIHGILFDSLKSCVTTRFFKALLP